MAANRTKPKGRKSDKMWRDAIHIAVKRVEKGENARALDKLARKLVDMAMAGSIAALKEIGDRLDGRPAQSTEIASRPKTVEEMTDEELHALLAVFTTEQNGDESADDDEPSSIH